MLPGSYLDDMSDNICFCVYPKKAFGYSQSTETGLAFVLRFDDLSCRLTRVSMCTCTMYVYLASRTEREEQFLPEAGF